MHRHLCAWRLAAVVFVCLTLSLAAGGCSDDSGERPREAGVDGWPIGQDARADQGAPTPDGYQWPEASTKADQGQPAGDQGAPTPDTGGPADQGGPSGDGGGGITGNNPDALGSGKRKTIVIDGKNTGGEWGKDTLLIRDPVADDARFLGSNWTAHEAPWDYAQLHAAWDDTYLYIGIQYVNVTDVLDPANLGSSEGSQIHGMDLIQYVVFDTGPGGYAKGGDMWNKTQEFHGKNQPDYQLYFHSNFSQEGTYLSKWDNTAKKLVQFTDGLKNKDLTGAGGEFYVGSTMPGVDVNADDTTPGSYGSKVVDYLTLGHQTKYDTFFELKIPVTLLGLNKTSLDTGAIGLFAGNGDGSSVDSIPNDKATSDAPGTSPSNSPLEWADTDTFTAPFVLVGTP